MSDSLVNGQLVSLETFTRKGNENAVLCCAVNEFNVYIVSRISFVSIVSALYQHVSLTFPAL